MNTVVPITVAAFSQAHPQVMVEVRDLRSGSIETLLLRGELDLGIAFHPTEHEEIETGPLFDERMLLVVGPVHPLAGRSSLAMKALEAMPLALLPRSFATRRLIDTNLRLAGVTPTVRVEMDSVEALLGVCRYSDLASIVPERAALQASDLHAIALTDPQLVRHAGILWRRGASRSTAARAFAALLLTPPTPTPLR